MFIPFLMIVDSICDVVSAVMAGNLFWVNTVAEIVGMARGMVWVNTETLLSVLVNDVAVGSSSEL